MKFLSGQPYSRRSVPSTIAAKTWKDWADALVPWLGTEFGNAQRGMSPAKSRLITSSETLSSSDGLVLVDATAGNVSVTLLDPADAGDNVVTIKRIDASGNTVTLVGTIDGSANPTLAQWKSKTIWSYAPSGSSAYWLSVAVV